MKNNFYKLLLSLALPITIQNLILSSINMADVFMIGTLGGSAVASLGVANQVVFILTTVLLAVSGGASIFSAQYYGSGETNKIKYVLSLALIGSSILTILFFIGAFIFPDNLGGLYTKDLEVIRNTSLYLKIVALSFAATALSSVFSVFLRSIGNSRVPMFASSSSLFINIALNYILIFGHLGAPALGIKGAAIATTIARTIEASIIVIWTYRNEPILAIKLRELLLWNRTIARSFMITAGAVILNDIFWATGQTTYSMIYGRISTSALAAINIENSIERIAYVGIIGFANAAAIMVGQKIGEGREDIAYNYGKKFYKLSIMLAIITSMVVFILSKKLIGLYGVEPEIFNLAHKALIAFCIIFPLKSISLIKIVGVLRAGGDTAFAMKANLGALWGVGIPLAAIGAFYFKFPLFIVYLMASSEDLIRIPFGFNRFKSKKWIKNFTTQPV